MRTISSIIVFLLAGCGSEVNSDYWLQLTPIVPYNQDPFAGDPDASLVITDASGNVDLYELGSLTTGTIELENMPPLADAQVGLMLFEPGSTTNEILAFGQTGPFDLARGNEDIDATLFVSELMAMGSLGELDENRLGAAAVLTSSGETFLFGGVTSPTATQASAEIAVLPPLDSGNWSFMPVGEIQDPDGSPVPLVGAEAILVHTGGKELIYVVGGTNHMRGLGLAPPMGFLFDPESREIVWWPQKDSQVPYYTKYEPYIATLADGTILSISTSYTPDEEDEDRWYLPSGPSAEIFDPESKTFIRREPVLSHPFAGFSVADVPLEGHLMCGGGVWTDNSLKPKPDCGLVTDQLKRIPWTDLPISEGTGLAFHAMVQLHDEENSILITGGVSTTATMTQKASAISKAWILRNPSSSAIWEPISDLNLPRAAHRMVATHDGGAIVFGGADGMGRGYATDFTSVECPERFDPMTQSFELVSPCEPAGAGPHPVFANHPDHEMLLIGNRMLSGGSAEFAVLPVLGPQNLGVVTAQE